MACISNEVICLQDFDKLHTLLAHLYGPNYHRVIINNKMVASSCELFESLSPKSDVITLMIGYLRQQTTLYKDGGLFVALLAVDIIRNFVKLETPLPLICQTNTFMLEWYRKHVQIFSLKCNTGKFNDVSKIVRPILLSKISLATVEFEHLSLLFARVFTMENSWRDCYVIKLENGDIMESCLDNGLLLRLDRYFRGTNDLKNVKVLLFSVSLALDSEEMLGDSQMTIEVGSRDKFRADFLMPGILDVCTAIASLVKVFICQKVIHPKAKKFFNDNDVICIDRVGGMCLPLLERVCGTVRVSSLAETDLSKHVGYISTMENVVINDQHYFKLYSSKHSEVKTLLLVANNEISTNVLYSCYEKCLIALRVTSSNHLVVCGGGCIETQLAMELLKLNQSLKYVRVFVSSLLSLSQAVSERSTLHHRVDKVNHHHWIGDCTRCCCGMFTKTSTMEFVSFFELLNFTGISIPAGEFPTEGEKGLSPHLVQSETIFSHNVSCAIQLANMVLRIGSKVVAN